ncbi:YdeI family protein [Rhodococcus sp. NPDC127528]|uniref:YdeI/OmpD-associated family protein n=1 Tax=unclassified Rhodococcus (in: high G+C Gram-positive bacteria) TaxID=192944 RepID=UPI00363D5762
MGAERTTEHFVDATDFRNWLAAHHDSSPGIWLKIAKKDRAQSSVSYDEAVDAALCFGWIDGQKRSFDDDFWLQGFTARRARSPWSKRNREKAERLLAQRLVLAPGLAEIEAAKADGRWDRAYDGQSTAAVPQDFLDALAQVPAAEQFFATLNKANRYAVAYRLQDAKKPETRARRIETYVQMFSEGRKIHG